MTETDQVHPDLTLLLDINGVIREATLSARLSGENVDFWVGRHWSEVAGEAGDKVDRLVSDTQKTGISAFRQITHRFPSGAELPMEFTTVLLGGRSGMLAIGKNLQAVAELHARLISAQQTIERDYWKLREIETRYRLVTEDSQDAVLIVRAFDMKVVEANATAVQALALSMRRNESVVGQDFLQNTPQKDRSTIEAMLRRVRDQGKAPGVMIHLGQDARPWTLRGSLMTSETAPVFLLQMTPATMISEKARDARNELDALLDAFPDGIVAIDPEGAIRLTNKAFQELIEIGSRSATIGRRLNRWMSRPGADVNALLTNVKKYGQVRLLSTALVGELGSETDVEISAAPHNDPERPLIVMVVRNVVRRLSTGSDNDNLRAALSLIGDELGKTSLRKLVRSAVEVVEQHYVKAALSLTDGNRTSAAEILGLSRQSLYAKMDRYGLDSKEPNN